MKHIVFSLFILIANHLQSATIYVTNTNDNGTGSLRAAISSASSGDEIRFDKNLIANGSDTINFNSPITISKGIFIHGLYNKKDTLYLSGKDSNSIFTISMSYGAAYINVHLDSLVLIHGKGTSGGAIFINNKYLVSNGYVFIRNCVFRDNYATEGGAIGGNRENSYSSEDFSIYLDLYNTDFINNGSSGKGGAIGFKTNATGTGTSRQTQIIIKANNVNFIGNKSGNSGGAISTYAYASSVSNHVGKCELLFNSCSFANNESKVDGGAIYCYSSSFSVLSTYAAKSKIDCTTSTFYNNKSVGNGGCFYLFSTSECRLYTRKSTIYKNYCLQDGSAAYLKSTASNNVSTSVVRHYSYSSIYLGNYGNSNYNNTQFMTGGFSRQFDCYGYNIFDVLKTHFVSFGNFGSNTDLFQKGNSELKLGSLKLNSRNTYSIFPDSGSIAINTGQKLDLDSAQNGPIFGVRDIGSTESNYCTPAKNKISMTICEGSSVQFSGKSIGLSGSYFDTISRQNDCDSIVELQLSVEPKLTPKASITGSYPNNYFLESSNASFIASGTNLGNAPTYQWYINGIKVGTNTNSYSNNSFKDQDSIFCIISSNLTCLSKKSDTSNTERIKIQTNNNEPCEAITLNVNSTCKIDIFTNSGASQTASVAPPSCETNATNDVWFKFTTPASGNVTFQTFSGFMSDAVISIYSGTCSNLVEIGCIDDVVNSKMPDGFLENATPNTLYYARISRSSQNDGTFGICLHDKSTQTNSIKKTNNNSINLYPNPTNSNLNILSEIDIISNILIYDISGHLISKFELNTNKYNLNLSNCISGIYVLKIETKNGTFQQLIEKK